MGRLVRLVLCALGPLVPIHSNNGSGHGCTERDSLADVETIKELAA